MTRTTVKQRLKNSLRTILATAALTISVTAAHAQFGYNLGQRLGGPLVAADNSGYGNYGGGYGGYGYGGYSGYAGNAYTNGNVGMNGGYNLPRPIIFSGNGVDSTFGSQLSTNVNTNNTFGIVNTAGANQLINDPLSGFLQPRTIIDPFTGLAVQQGFNTATNQFVNGQYLNGQNPFNSGFGVNANGTVNTSAQNTNTQRRIVYTTVPVQSMSGFNQTVTANGLAQYNGRMVAANKQANTPYFTSIPLPSDGTQIPLVNTNGTVYQTNAVNGPYFTSIPLPADGTQVPIFANSGFSGRAATGFRSSGFGIQSSMRSIRR